jgi:hypothetical protein
MEQIFGVSETRPENNMVNDYYRGLLSRIPENDGFNYWLGRFRDEQCYGDAESIRDLALEIASGFIYTSEYTNRNRDDLGYIEDLYDAFMRRGGDSGGVNHFLTGLGDGTYTRDELLQIFVNSPEFQGRVQDVIDAGVDDIECPIRYTISGTVTGDVQDGVTITLTGDDSDTTTTDSNGDYSFTGLSNGSYIVTPSKSGYTFDPTYKNVTISLGSKTGINFIASELNCAPGCFDSLLGDGECDDDCNVSACDYDDGDCEDCAPGCFDFMLGDGECNDECNYPECNFDDFDC